MQCKFCNTEGKWSDVIRSEDNPIDGYDAFYCLSCDVWLDVKCSDSECEFCSGRPDKPSDTYKECVKMDYEQLYYQLLQKMEGQTKKMEQSLSKMADKEQNQIFKYETTDKVDFMYAMHGLDFLLCLWDLDQALRAKVKYSTEMNEDERVGYEKARGLLHEIMEEHNLNLDMLR